MNNDIPLLQVARTMTELKAMQPVGQVLMLGKTTIGDGMGGFYYWDSSNASAEDTKFLNTLTSGVVGATGRWMRVFQKALTLPQGYLIFNGGVKTLYITNATTDANGKVTSNLTYENASNGTAIFSEVWQKSFDFPVAVSSANDVPSGSSAAASDLKTVTYTFSKGNSSTISILGVNILGMRAVAAGLSVILKVEGI